MHLFCIDCPFTLHTRFVCVVCFVVETNVVSCVLLPSPFHNNRFVVPLDFCNRLLLFLFPMHMLHPLIAVALCHSFVEDLLLHLTSFFYSVIYLYTWVAALAPFPLSLSSSVFSSTIYLYTWVAGSKFSTSSSTLLALTA